MIVTTGGSELSTLLCLFVLGGALILGITTFSRSRGKVRSRHPDMPLEAPLVPLADLNNQANSYLVEADNALKTSEQELGFASAQYGAQATQSFAAALAAAKEEVSKAFALRQQLDDAYPEDEPTQRTMLAEIIERCSTADERLDAEADAFAQLRALESKVDELIPALTARAETVKSRIAGATATSSELSATYADSALVAISGNIDQAKARIEFTAQQLTEAGTALTAGDRGKAALASRAAEQSISQAEVLLDAIDKTKTDLATAGGRLSTLLTDMQGDIAAGRAAMQAGTGAEATDQMSLAAAVARAEQVVTDIRTQIGGARPDPMQAMQRLEAASAELGGALEQIRDAAARKQHARSLLEQTVFSARSNVQTATDFISTRRGAVGAQARTRLTEAQRYLDQATSLAATDPENGLVAAQRAQSLAEQALSAARNDVESWMYPSGPSFGGGGGPIIVGGPAGMGGAVLGGILLESMFGGGGRRGPYVRTGGFRLGFVPQAEQPVPGRFGGPSTWSRN